MNLYKEGRESPTVVHLVAFDGGLCGEGVCGIFRGNVVASWPLLPLRTHFIEDQLLVFLCRPKVVHTSTPCLDWVTLALWLSGSFPFH